MSPELDAQLCRNYPEIFQDRRRPKSDTAMCYGFSCGDGWYALIDELCAHLMIPVTRLRESLAHHRSVLAKPIALRTSWERNLYDEKNLVAIESELARAEAAIPVALQVKEKFGTLRFYTRNSTEDQMNIIAFAENMSGRICEECGTTKDAKTGGNGWIRTLCPTCRPPADVIV